MRLSVYFFLLFALFGCSSASRKLPDELLLSRINGYRGVERRQLMDGDYAVEELSYDELGCLNSVSFTEYSRDSSILYDEKIKNGIIQYIHEYDSSWIYSYDGNGILQRTYYRSERLNRNKSFFQRISDSISHAVVNGDFVINYSTSKKDSIMLQSLLLDSGIGNSIVTSLDGHCEDSRITSLTITGDEGSTSYVFEHKGYSSPSSITSTDGTSRTEISMFNQQGDLIKSISEGPGVRKKESSYTYTYDKSGRIINMVRIDDFEGHYERRVTEFLYYNDEDIFVSRERKTEIETISVDDNKLGLRKWRQIENVSGFRSPSVRYSYYDPTEHKLVVYFALFGLERHVLKYEPHQKSFGSFVINGSLVNGGREFYAIIDKEEANRVFMVFKNKEEDDYLYSRLFDGIADEYLLYAAGDDVALFPEDKVGQALLNQRKKTRR